MPFCPKCERAGRDGETECVRCAVALVPRLANPEIEGRIGRLENELALAMFRSDAGAFHFCPECYREFARAGAVCGPCGEVPAESASAEGFRALLAEGPLERARRIAASAARGGELETEGAGEDSPFRGVAARRPVAPSAAEAKASVRVAAVDDPASARILLAALEKMGLEPFVGDDLLDDFGDTDRLAIRVPPYEVEAAEMLLPSSLAGLPRATAPTDYPGRVARAEAYGRWGRFRSACRHLGEIIAAEPERPEAFLALAGMAARRGLHREAATAWEEAAARLPLGAGSRATLEAAVHGFLDDGRPAFRGDRADHAWRLLRSFCAAVPRHVPARQLALEAAVARRHDRIARELLLDLSEINPTLLSREGPHARAARALNR
ncbi:MAG: hypothetical protein R3F20_10115 [Planctomycetota bacterium]